VPVVETSGPSETEALGAELALRLRDGDLVLVSGELGSGKTTFVRGAARALGVTDPITSPSFSIGHRYRGASVTVSHLDLYRLGGLGEEDPDLLDDYLGAGRIAFVEWPVGDSPELAHARVRVELTHEGGDRRRIEIAEGSDGERAGAKSDVDRAGAESDVDRAGAEDADMERAGAHGAPAGKAAS
jgi:tRNA threonylcarbamoyladenosine biosynthesis protein TsaE